MTNASLSPAGRRYPVRRSVVKPHEAQLAAATRHSLAAVPPAGDLWTAGHVPPIWDQGAEGSCTAHGTGRAYETQRRSQGHAPMDPSRAFLYDLERLKEGTALTDDAGAFVPDGPAVLAESGCCDSALYPYTAADLSTAPPDAVRQAAAPCKVSTWARVANAPEAIVAAIAQGYAVAFGMDVYQSFESAVVARTGVVPMPQAGEQKLGGHCMCLTGWDVTAPAHNHTGFLGWFEDRLAGMVPEDGWFWCDNSWGATWGINGRCRIPFAMFRRGFAYDAVVIQQVAA